MGRPPEPHTPMRNLRIGKPPGRFLQKLPDGGRLMGVVPLVPGEQNAVVGGIQDHRLDGGGPHIHAEAQNI